MSLALFSYHVDFLDYTDGSLISGPDYEVRQSASFVLLVYTCALATVHLLGLVGQGWRHGYG